MRKLFILNLRFNRVFMIKIVNGIQKVVNLLMNNKITINRTVITRSFLHFMILLDTFYSKNNTMLVNFLKDFERIFSTRDKK